METLQRRVTWLGFGLALVVVVLGAYTRLTDAGLGCPDWPGCYGQLTVPMSQSELAAAERAFPGEPVDIGKAWNEMVHRYVAGSLGLVIALLAGIALWRRRRGEPGPLKLPLLLLAVVCFQAVLGMWTVTWDLLPEIVLAHLLGGFTTLALLFLLGLRLSGGQRPGQKTAGQQVAGQQEPAQGAAGRWLLLCLVAIVLLTGQIVLGGWTSANYAALVCTELPLCEGQWQERLDFAAAFAASAEADSYQYGVRDYAARMTIHISHRLGAIVLSLWLLGLFVLLWRYQPALRRLCLAGGLLLLIQVSLGVSNVLFTLPLPVAVAHNATAALLLLALIAVSRTLWLARHGENNLQERL